MEGMYYNPKQRNEWVNETNCGRFAHDRNQRSHRNGQNKFAETTKVAEVNEAKQNHQNKENHHFY